MAHTQPPPRNVVETAKYLVTLLGEARPYRARWQAKAERSSAASVHQGAVARVLAAYLWDSGQAPDTDQDLPRRLKDTVSRALRGKVLAPVTLGWFIEAFAMSAVDAARLWTIYTGTVTVPAARSQVRLQFHPDCPPAAVWWGVWAAAGDPEPVHQEPCALEADRSVYRYVDTREGHTVGFFWRWPG
jgi:hypothetical protein